MLGWDIYIYQSNPLNDSSDMIKSSDGILLASWPTGILGRDWLDDLVKDEKAIDLGGNGYPDRYTAEAKNVLPLISYGTSKQNGVPVFGKNYFTPSGFNSELHIYTYRIDICKPEDMLMIEVWDQS